MVSYILRCLPKGKGKKKKKKRKQKFKLIKNIYAFKIKKKKTQNHKQTLYRLNCEEIFGNDILNFKRIGFLEQIMEKYHQVRILKEFQIAWKYPVS